LFYFSLVFLCFFSTQIHFVSIFFFLIFLGESHSSTMFNILLLKGQATFSQNKKTRGTPFEVLIFCFFSFFSHKR